MVFSTVPGDSCIQEIVDICCSQLPHPTQNVIKAAIEIAIVAVSVFFLIWDAVNMGRSIYNLVKKKESKAVRKLKSKLEDLEGKQHVDEQM